MSNPSVRGSVLLLLLLPLLSFRFDAGLLPGKWQCSTKSGYLDVHTSYQLNCGGILHFKTDQRLESTCSDGFFPSGTRWQLNEERILLSDSDGRMFADFEIKSLDEKYLVLTRKGIEYAFERVPEK